MECPGLAAVSLLVEIICLDSPIRAPVKIKYFLPGASVISRSCQLLWRLPACVSEDPLALPQINLWYPTQLLNLNEFQIGRAHV